MKTAAKRSAASFQPKVVASSQPVLRRGVEADAPALYALITANLTSGHLLPRTLSELTVYAHRFTVASCDGRIVACGELMPLSRKVAEVRSLVVDEGARGSGLGRLIVADLRARARREGYETLCAFTHNPSYFVRFGFSIVPHFWLPEKIATSCWSCDLFQRCGQYAMVDQLGSSVRPLPARLREDASARQALDREDASAAQA
jgi:amino-acid N-acetyltransferase